MTTKPPPMCIVCEHFFDSEWTCTAFPDGIPRDIMFEFFDHRKPHEGDNGIRFKLKEGKEFPLFLY